MSEQYRPLSNLYLTDPVEAYGLIADGLSYALSKYASVQDVYDNVEPLHDGDYIRETVVRKTEGNPPKEVHTTVGLYSGLVHDIPPMAFDSYVSPHLLSLMAMAHAHPKLRLGDPSKREVEDALGASRDAILGSWGRHEFERDNNLDHDVLEAALTDRGKVSIALSHNKDEWGIGYITEIGRYARWLSDDIYRATWMH